MKKIFVLISLVLSVAFLAVLLPLPTISAWSDYYPWGYACECRHWNDDWECTSQDQFTGIGLSAYYYPPSYYYCWLNWTFVAAWANDYGPCYFPGYSGFYCMREWFEAGMGYRDYPTYGYSWSYPWYGWYDYPYHGEEQQEIKTVVNGLYQGGTAQVWFVYPPQPNNAYWYCQTDLAQNFAQ